MNTTTNKMNTHYYAIITVAPHGARGAEYATSLKEVRETKAWLKGQGHTILHTVKVLPGQSLRDFAHVHGVA